MSQTPEMAEMKATRDNLIHAGRQVKAGTLHDVVILGTDPTNGELVLYGSGQTEAELVFIFEAHKMAVMATVYED